MRVALAFVLAALVVMAAASRPGREASASAR